MNTGEHKVKRPTHEAHWNERLFETGIGWVMVARFKAGGARVEVGIFLVDAWCLGIKNAIYHDGGPEEYRDTLQKQNSDPDTLLSPVDPSYARKLVEGALAYARNLGLPPHEDYRMAARVFGGIDPAQCQENFTFGRNNKPCYVQGPHESAFDAEAIVAHLLKKCGEGNFDFMILET